jgi:RNA polymerase sigma-70 factor (ECF subfamily)
MPLEDREFREQIEQARAGNVAALGQLLESYRTYLLLVANQEIEAPLRPKVAASDIVQNVFLRARVNLADFRGEGEAEWRGWIRQILLRDLQDMRRRYLETEKRNIAKEVSLNFHPQGQSRDATTRDVVEPRLTPHSSAIVQEEAAILRVALARLTEEYQQVIQLRNWELLSFEEIGARMDRTADAARKLWSRAILRLQTELSHGLSNDATSSHKS